MRGITLVPSRDSRCCLGALTACGVSFMLLRTPSQGVSRLRPGYTQYATAGAGQVATSAVFIIIKSHVW